MFDWFFIVNKEAINGFHTKKVQLGILKGMVLFIASEIMFFFSIFWAFLCFKFNPSVFVWCSFPPYGINLIKLDCFPLLNTVFLVYSGCFLTLSLDFLKRGGLLVKDALIYLFITIILGILFVMVQFIEYTESVFSFNDSCYGSVFFLLTGFHGFHVIIGLIFLFVCFVRMYIQYKEYYKLNFKFKLDRKFNAWKSIILWLNYNNCSFKKKSMDLGFFFSSRLLSNSFLIPFLGFKRDTNIGYICASWYWHFVDAIWIVVISVIYSDIVLKLLEFVVNQFI